MKSTRPLAFKIASTDWEFEQIYRLNYKTFVEEIPQHEFNKDKRLIDKSHKENTYIVCLCGDTLLGMVAIRDKRPFSLDQKLENLDSYLPKVRSICEIRLLSVDGNNRSGRIFLGLLTRLAQYYESKGYDLAIISGTTRELKLYKHLGFVPFGPLVGTQQAMFQPMYLTAEAFVKLKGKLRILSHVLEERDESISIFSRPLSTTSTVHKYMNLLPGPVGINKEVRKVFARTPVSHRSKGFMEDLHQTKRLLCQLVGSQYVEILMGSGTLANDAMAAQLSLRPGRGLILNNGEFGNRLIDHAIRFGLSFDIVQLNWGDVFDRDKVKHIVAKDKKIAWLWATHCETSTGVLNDMYTLKEISAERGILLCMDCVSSIGTVPVDLQGVFLASSVSGKGLGAFTGLSMVFYNHKISPASDFLPKYLDLGFYAACDGVPFTLSSNLVYALKTALERFHLARRFSEITRLSAWLRPVLRDKGFHILAPDTYASPAVITITLPETINSVMLGQQLEESGYLLGYESEYLLKRNWLQISFMGECSQKSIAPLLNILEEYSSVRA